jgi:plasmid stabilization system protein ParE
MVTKVIWNKAASRTFDDITICMVDNISLQSAQNFAVSVYEKIDYIIKYPFVGRKVRGTKSLKMLNIGKHHHIYFRVHGNTLFISDFFDTRQNPDKRPY